MQHKYCLYSDMKTDDDFILSQIPDDAIIIDERDFNTVFDVIDACVYAEKEYDANKVYLIQEYGTLTDGSEYHISGKSFAKSDETMSNKYPERFITPKDIAEYPQELSVYSTINNK